MTTWKPAELSQIRQLRLLSATYFSDNDLIFKEIGKPKSRLDASRMLQTVDALPLGATIEDLREALPGGIDVEKPDGTEATTPRRNEEEIMPDPDTRRCKSCGEHKPLDQYRVRGAGRQRTCNDCYEDPRTAPTRKPSNPPAHKQETPAEPQETAEPTPPPPAPAPAGSNGTGWVKSFYNPTLLQLRLLSQFLGGVTLDECAQVCEEVIGALDGDR